MADEDSTQVSAELGGEPVSDYRRPPKGVIPKNATTWVIVGVSVFVIAVLIFVGPDGRRSKDDEPEPHSQVETRPLSEEEELNRRLAEQLRQQEESMRAIARAASTPAPTPAELNFPQQQQQAGELSDDLADRMRELEYTSLFASNIALTYRDDEHYTNGGLQNIAAGVPGAQQFQPGAFAAPPTPEQFQQMFPPPTYAPPPSASPEIPAASATAQAEPRELPLPPAPNPPGDRISSKEYTLFEGTIVDTALVNRLDSTFAGPIITMVTNDVYSHDRQRVLIPSGTKCIGRTTAVESLGQSRMAVSFHRLIMPDGYSVDLDQFEGLNQLGDTGLKDKVNHHYFQVFGVSIALGFLGAISQREFEEPFDSAGPQFARSAAQILDRFLNIAPTVTIREGHRIKVYLMQDLRLPAYSTHAMRSNL